MQMKEVFELKTGDVILFKCNGREQREIVYKEWGEITDRGGYETYTVALQTLWITSDNSRYFTKIA